MIPYLRRCLGYSLTGATREQMIGKLDHDYLPKEQADAFMADDREVLASGQAKVVEEQVTPAGVPLWFRTRKVAIADSIWLELGCGPERGEAKGGEDAAMVFLLGHFPWAPGACRI